MSNHKSLDLLAEMQDTEGVKDWKAKLLARLESALGQWGKWADKVGFGINEMQIKFKQPIASMFAFEPLDILWVQFNVLEPQTKKSAKQVVRFGSDTAVLMTLVKVPHQGTFKWYMLARKKYQFAAKDLFFECSRGWVANAKKEDQGWKLFERDYPGLKDSQLVSGITEQMIGNPVWENNAQFSNKIGYHLVVVEIAKEVSKDELEKLLVTKKLEQEYLGENTQGMTAKDLKSCPVVIELELAASHLNAHLEGSGDKLYLFGENYSLAIWPKFLSLWGWQFPNLMPTKGKSI